MLELRYLDQAIEDFVDIELYIVAESGDEELALHFTEQLKAKCRRLAALPGEIGRARPELQDGLRSIPHGNYVIFFLYDGPYLDIVTIIEGHRDIDTVFESR